MPKIERSALRVLASYGIAKIIPGILMMLAVPIWIRTFGASSYGIFTVCWAAAILASSLTSGWLRQGLLRYSGQNQLQLDALPKWLLPVLSTACILPVAVIASIATSSQSQAQWTIALACFFGVLTTWYSIMQVDAQQDGRARAYSAAEITRISGALLLSLGGVNLLGFRGADSILGAYSLATLLSIRILIRSRSRSTITRSSKNPDSTRIHWKYGWPMTFWLASSTSLVYMDRTVLSHIEGPESAGTYGAIADLIVRGFAMITFPLTMASHPVVMRSWNSGDYSSAIRTNQRYLMAMSAVCGIAIVGAMLLGDVLMKIALGTDVLVPPIIFPLALGAALWQMALLVHKPLEMQGKTGLMAVLMVSISVGSLALNIALVPQLGMVISAWIYAGGSLLYLCIVFALSRSLARSL